MQTVTRKVPGGKLLRLKARLEEGRIKGPQISGDFFLTPPEKIAVIEEALEGFPISDADGLAELLNYVIERDGIRMQGIAVDDILAVVGELK